MQTTDAGPQPQPEPESPPRRRSPARTALAWTARVLLALVCVPLGFRLADADGPATVIQVLAFLPWLAAPALLALVLALFARCRPTVVWAVVTAGVLVWSVVAAGAQRQPPGAGGPDVRFRALTANLQYGDATPALVELLRKERPQIVAVQECDTTCATALDTPDLRKAYPHRVMDVREGSGGSALLSAYPLRRTAGVQGELAMPGAVADVEGTRVDVQLAHPLPPLEAYASYWRTELGRLADWARERKGQPALLVGDFNATPHHAAFRSVLDAGGLGRAAGSGLAPAATWPTDRGVPPLAHIDHVLLGERLSAGDVRTVELPGSDHRAVLADLELRRPR